MLIFLFWNIHIGSIHTHAHTHTHPHTHTHTQQGAERSSTSTESMSHARRPPTLTPHPSHRALFVSRLPSTLGDRSLSSRQRRRRLRRLGTDQSVSTSQPLHKRCRADNLGPSARIGPIADSTATLSGACQAEARRGVLQSCPRRSGGVWNQAFPATGLSCYQTSVSVTRPFLLPDVSVCNQAFPGTGLSCYRPFLLQTSVSVTRPFLVQTFSATRCQCR